MKICLYVSVFWFTITRGIGKSCSRKCFHLRIYLKQETASLSKSLTDCIKERYTVGIAQRSTYIGCVFLLLVLVFFSGRLDTIKIQE